ncbi:WD repeat-containing protein 44-like [Abrus precatorius]|uniref:WD repeat-containing protein 44-like n=1 Tax=Abrus precatorius TaxID=3816 RepID=A0A8B8MIU2_ABRPR|nr:WD repeat-containing protein 44-like [Abrus precatorius]
MGSFSGDEECRFFDAQEDVGSITDDEGVSKGFDYEVWVRSPRSVRERRSKFMERMGLSMDWIALENSVDACSVECEELMDRVKLEDASGAVTRTSVFEEQFCSSRSMSCWHSGNSSEEGSVDDLPCQDGDLEGNVDQEGKQCRKMNDGRDLDSDQFVVAREPEDSENASGVSPCFQGREDREKDVDAFARRTNRDRKGWFRRLRSMTCMIDRQGEGDNGRSEGSGAMSGSRLQKVKVRQSRKHMKELSALYMRQDIQAHEGSILTMKFSPDGQYLASGGEDGVVRLWQVVEEDRCNEIDIPEIDPSCIYFTVNNLSELTPLFMDKEKISKLKSLKKTSDSACVVFPPKIFRLLEKPLHEFCGHRGEVLDLSWSKNNYLLSSSVDKTVRLWNVNHDHCLKVFSHSNYVTCIQFNPMDDNYFISGSIDGKVRIWEIPDCHVVDWTDIKDIVTAVCYRPDGQGGIIGSLAGYCRFYNVSENRLQLDTQLCLIGKKKLTGRGITGFQFLPQDSNKVMVTCADSKVRILDGLHVIGKYKSLSTGSPLCASFTSDGKHILSACKDSNVYLWNISEEQSNPMKARKIRSCEQFFSNASVAVPWHGLKSLNPENEHQLDVLDKKSPQVIHLNPPTSFSLSQEFFLGSFPKGSATWPEEKLPISSSKSKTSMIHKSEYKFLKSSCKSTSSAHAWGMVIVTAGWDGRIKSFHNYGLPIPV